MQLGQGQKGQPASDVSIQQACSLGCSLAAKVWHQVSAAMCWCMFKECC